jgi:hypothetical protein
MPKKKRHRRDSNAPLRVGLHIQVYHHALSRWQRDGSCRARQMHPLTEHAGKETHENCLRLLTNIRYTKVCALAPRSTKGASRTMTLLPMCTTSSERS